MKQESSEALRYTLGSTPIDVAEGEGEESAAFLGREGDVYFYIDKYSRTPLQVSGSIPVLGKVKFKLTDKWVALAGDSTQ